MQKRIGRREGVWSKAGECEPAFRLGVGSFRPSTRTAVPVLLQGKQSQSPAADRPHFVCASPQLVSHRQELAAGSDRAPLPLLPTASWQECKRHDDASSALLLAVDREMLRLRPAPDGFNRCGGATPSHPGLYLTQTLAGRTSPCTLHYSCCYPCYSSPTASRPYEPCALAAQSKGPTVVCTRSVFVVDDAETLDCPVPQVQASGYALHAESLSLSLAPPLTTYSLASRAKGTCDQTRRVSLSRTRSAARQVTRSAARSPAK